MNDSTSFTGHFAFLFSQTASRLGFRIAKAILASLAILPTTTTGWAQSVDFPQAAHKTQQVISGTKQEDGSWAESSLRNLCAGA